MIKILKIFPVVLLFTLGAAACNSLPDVQETPRDPDVLFQDDFSSKESGWDQVRDETGITDYEQGGYRIQVLETATDFWSNPGLNFTDVTIDVKVQTLAGPEANDFGVICRYQDNDNFYFFIAGNDGYFGVGLVVDGTQNLIGLEALEYSEAINQGNTASNTIHVECIGDTLRFYVNDTLLSEKKSDTFASGDVGLIAGTFTEPGTDVLFDNFVVRRP